MRLQPAPSCLLAILVCIAFAAVASAIEHNFTESFNTKQYCDTVNTTALWDTVAGELRLSPCEFGFVGTYDTPGSASGVAIDGDFAYVADGTSGLQIIDITDPENPVLVGTYNTPGTASDVFVDGNHVYVADGTAGVRIVDVTNPAAPTLLGFYSTGRVAYDVVVEGDYAYVAFSTNGLVVLNVADPASPTFVGGYDTPGSSRGVAVAGNLAFVADSASGLQIIDITNPASPVLVGAYDTPGSARGVAVAGDKAYVVDGSSGMQVIDITNPVSPVFAGGVTLDGTANRVAVDGDHAYVAALAAGLFEIDISDPSAPAVTRSLSVPDDAWDIAVDGEHAFVADYGAGLRVARIACPAPLLVAGQCSTWGYSMDVAVDGDYAYVADAGMGVQAFDISDPTAPVLVGGYITTAYCYYVAVDGDYAVGSLQDSSVVVLDISDPANPTLLGSYDTPDVPYGLDIAGDYVFVATNNAGLLILDISNPAAPTLLGTYNPSGLVHDVAVAGNYAYLASGGFLVVDISDPAHPALAGSCAAGAYSVAVAGDHAYVVRPTYPVSSIDISNPSSPAVVSTASLHSAGYGNGIAVTGNSAYVAAGSPYRSLQRVDISNPHAIAVTEWVSTSEARAVACAGEYAFVAAGSDLATFRIAVRDYLASANRGQSLVVNTTGEQIVKVRLSAVQNGSLHWMLSADGGANWKSVSPDWTWQTLSSPGSGLFWRNELFFADAPDNPTCSQLALEWLYQPAIVDSICDIPGDQGGQVRVFFARSGYDFADETTHPIASYNLWRRVDDVAARTAIAREAPSCVASGEAGGAKSAATPAGLPLVNWRDRLFLRSGSAALPTSFPDGTWELVTNVASVQRDQYTVIAPTLADSTLEGMFWSVYMVTAHTTTPSVWYASPPDSGYSRDNLAPHVPTTFVVAQHPVGGNDLSWDACPDHDFEYFKVYRGATAEFVPGLASLVHQTTNAGWVDTAPGSYGLFYKVSAVDHAGNESSIASASAVTGVMETAPSVFVLRQNVPNPFNPATVIGFSVAQKGRVRLVVYDLSGRLVRVLLDEVREAGNHQVQWNGTNDRGARMGSGTYLCRLESGSLRETKRMTLIK